MSEKDWRAERFEENRGHLRAVAFRMLGSRGEAEDAVQEAWLRFDRADTGAVGNLGGWLTTVVARVCLDLLRSRKSRREESLDAQPFESIPARDAGPEHHALVADAVGPALLLVLDSLEPAERLAFVLHDTFGVPFEEIARIVDRTPDAARQLASRARRRIQGASPTGAADRSRQRAIVDAFLAASREGNFEGLLRVLAPGVVLRADAATVASGAQAEVRGAAAVAETFKGRASAAQPAWLDGAPGAVWAPGGRPRVVFAFTFEDDSIVAIDLLADPERIGAIDLVIDE